LAKRTRIFFATDIHGSDTCFKKFVNAGQFYKAQVLVLGGDITGKVLISIVKRDDGKFFFNSPKREPVVATDKELEQHEQNLAAAGYYPYRLPPSEAQEFNENREFKDKVFHGLILDRLRKWVEIADTRLASSGIKCYVQGGNDDSPEIDDVLKTSKTITIPERKVVMIDDSHEMISTGYTNMTPWKCPKDIPDEELGSMIEEMAKQVKNMKSCVFNFHCPPYDS
jgi:Icc-related predicted phosphoesterase